MDRRLLARLFGAAVQAGLVLGPVATATAQDFDLVVSRVLGRYVREAKSLSLMDALRKMTLMPARRLEARVPAMAAKGRIRVGADADLTIFDMDRVLDRATYREPSLPPDGIRHVIVGGVPVVSDGKPVSGVSPGRPVRAPQR